MDLRELAASGTQRHPWELARADLFCRLLSRRVLAQPISRILDVGAGDGFLASRLATLCAPGTEVVCVDAHYDPVVRARLQASMSGNVRLSRELPDVRADLVLLLDVLEHIEDDRAFLRELVQHRLAPGGFMLVSVPAWPRLFGRHDAMLAHHRRYQPAAARALLLDAGLEICECGGAFHSLLPVRALQAAAHWFSPEPAEPPATQSGAQTDLTTWRHGPRISRLVLRALHFDNALSAEFAARGIEVPGLTWWALCRNSLDRSEG